MTLFAFVVEKCKELELLLKLENIVVHYKNAIHFTSKEVFPETSLQKYFI